MKYILFYPITLEGRWGTTDEFATIHLDLFSAALVELAKSNPVHSLILSSHLFFCLPLFLFPFTVPCRIVFAKPEDLETWPNHLSFHFLTRVRSSSYSPMAAWIFLRTSSLATWSLYVANTAESGEHGYAVWTLVSATWPRITGLQAINIFSKMQLVHVCTWECRYLSSQSNILEYMDIRSLSCQG